MSSEEGKYRNRFRNLASRKKEREKKELDKEPTPGSGTQHPGNFMTQTKFTLEFGDTSSKGHWTFRTMFLDDEAEMFLKLLKGLKAVT